MFASTTFMDICKNFNDILNEYDFEMKDLILDFDAFCFESDLIDNAKTKMRAVLTSNTFKQNMKYNIYYAPSDRGYQNYKYWGLYNDKAIRAIGEVICSADVDLNSGIGELIVKDLQIGTLNDKQKNNIKIVMKEAKEKYGYIITEESRFFFVDKYYETEYTKPTKGGLMGQKYFDVSDVDGYIEDMGTKEIADLLRGKAWS